MYWVDPEQSKIETAWMDGTHISTFVSERLVQPSGISVDNYMSNRVFWCDEKLGHIESANFDGSDRSIILPLSGKIFDFFLLI